MSRIPLLSVDSELTAEQRRVVDGILAKRGGKIPGPYRLSLHCPALTEVWHPLGEMLRLRSSFPLRLSELAILITARAWACDYVFQAHSPFAREGGIKQSAIDALARGERPAFENADEQAVYDYCTELFENRAISDRSYAQAKELFGVPGVVELTALSGYYGMVAMTLVAHEMPLPEGVKPPLARQRT